MNSLFSRHRWMQVMWGILLFVAGTITIVFTATSEEGADAVGLALSISLAVVLFAYGLTILFTTFLEMKNKMFKVELIFGAIIVAVAMVFVLKFDIVKNLIVLFAAINLLSFGIVFVVRAILCFTQKIRPVWRIFCIIFGVAFIACGVLAIIFEDKCLEICYFVIGALLIIAAIGQIVLAIKESMNKAKAQKPVPVTESAPKAQEPVKEEVKVVDYTEPAEEVKAIEDKSE